MSKTNRPRLVEIDTRPVGVNFACCGVVRDARSRRKLAETRDFPYGFDAQAFAAARELAAAKGWEVVS